MNTSALPMTASNPAAFAPRAQRDDALRQAITAAGSGCAAAIDAERWLEAQDHLG